jgi:Uncharacterized protein involved in propionate catabolism
MDPTTEYLSDYVCKLTYEDLSPEATHQVKRTLIDSLGCAVGAFDSEPASIARRMASRVQGSPPARILCTSQETSADMAAFANTCLVRYLDCNDAYAARGTGHPSDMIPGVLAVAGSHRMHGRAVITAIKPPTRYSVGWPTRFPRRAGTRGCSWPSGRPAASA